MSAGESSTRSWLECSQHYHLEGIWIPAWADAAPEQTPSGDRYCSGISLPGREVRGTGNGLP